MRILSPLLAAVALAALLATAPAARAQSQADIEESIAALEIGTAGLTGRPRATRTVIAEAGKKRGLFRRAAPVEAVYTRNQPVYLIPYTRLMEAQLKRHNNNGFMVMSSLGKLAEYHAVVLTDDNGVFRFRGLKPGWYLLSTKVPYEAAVTVRDDTGMTRTETTIETQGDMIVGASSVTSPVYNFRQAVTDLEHSVFKLVEVKADRPVTELGELQ